jgi:hypothetical protein
MMKKSVKYGLIILSILIVVLFILKYLFLSSTILRIKPADQVCEVDDDCTTAMTKCSCDCGTPVNIEYKTKYRDIKAKRCKFYFGMMCMMRCDKNVTCIDNVCSFQE